VSATAQTVRRDDKAGANRHAVGLVPQGHVAGAFDPIPERRPGAWQERNARADRFADQRCVETSAG
jgi:hypothetical protein